MQNDAILLERKQITILLTRPRGYADLCSHTIKQNRYSHDIILYTLFAFKLQSMLTSLNDKVLLGLILDQTLINSIEK